MARGRFFAAAERTGSRTATRRTGAVAAVFALAFFAVGVKLVIIGAQSNTAREQRPVAAETPPLERADIVDREGKLLATDLPIASLYADARQVWDAGETARELVQVLPELSEAELIAKLSSGQAFVWLKRDLTPRQHAAVHELGLPGLGFRREEKRIYPNAATASHILGFVDVDNRGLAGIERHFDRELRDPARGGAPLELSIDLRVQHVLENELARATANFDALGAAGIVLDVASGEIVAMASLPNFDPNRPGDFPEETRFDRATLGVYEMGSTFKTFTTAMALDLGVVGLDGGYDASKPIRFGRFEIKDYHPQNRFLTVPEIFKYSSNIGAAKMALATGAERQRAFLGSLGLLDPAALEIPETGAPLVPSRWGELETMTIGYGHGIAVTPIQSAAALAAVANGGLYIAPTLIKRRAGEEIPAKRVISGTTSSTMRGLLRLVVTEGTGRKADVAGYPVGGKTGTADKPLRGGYASHAVISSFAGVFPWAEPRYLVLIILDEPKPTRETQGYATGGWTAAPTAASVISRIAPMLGVLPEPVSSEDAGPDSRAAIAGDDR